jgi:hypothetical protein
LRERQVQEHPGRRRLGHRARALSWLSPRAWRPASSPRGPSLPAWPNGRADRNAAASSLVCTEAGIARDRDQGKKFGRPSALDVGQKRKIAERYAAGETMAQLATDYDVGEATIFRALQAPFERAA